MATLDGFIKYSRQSANAESPNDRISHFNEFYTPYTEQTLTQQTARCMDCGVPFCHYKCPLENNIPDFNQAAHEGRWEDAYTILTKTNPFPEFTGRICPAPCEQGCVLGINSEAVTIEEIEKTIAEKAFELSYVKAKKPTKYNGKKIAIIGSGPAGLSAAHYLNQAGYTITVYEKDKKLGGLLRYGIPDFKLEKKYIERRIQILIKEGIHFITETEVGKDIEFDMLEKNYDAIILAIGAQKPRSYDIESKNIIGVHYAMEYLTQANRIVSKEQKLSKINVKGKHVVVIGGGDTGSDCIGTANREGALSITQLDYHNKPPLIRSEKTPWPMDAVVYQESTSHQEGCNRIFKSFATHLNTEKNQLVSISISEVEIKNDVNGTKTKQKIPNTSRTIPCDILFIAIGFTGPKIHPSLKKIDFKRVSFNSKEYVTNDSKYYLLGDARIGQSLVVNALAEGRNIVNEIDRKLNLDRADL